MSLIERARFLASGQDDPHSVTITELCDQLEAMQAEVEMLNRECEQRVRAYQIAHDQATANGAASNLLRAITHSLLDAAERNEPLSARAIKQLRASLSNTQGQVDG